MIMVLIGSQIELVTTVLLLVVVQVMVVVCRLYIVSMTRALNRTPT